MIFNEIAEDLPVGSFLSLLLFTIVYCGGYCVADVLVVVIIFVGVVAVVVSVSEVLFS